MHLMELLIDKNLLQFNIKNIVKQQIVLSQLVYDVQKDLNEIKNSVTTIDTDLFLHRLDTLQSSLIKIINKRPELKIRTLQSYPPLQKEFDKIKN